MDVSIVGNFFNFDFLGFDESQIELIIIDGFFFFFLVSWTKHMNNYVIQSQNKSLIVAGQVESSFMQMSFSFPITKYNKYDQPSLDNVIKIVDVINCFKS